MTCHKYLHVMNAHRLYTEVWIDSVSAEGDHPVVADRCSWDMLKATYNNAQITHGHYQWKDAVIKGIRFALSKIETQNPYRIILQDVHGHILHSNLHVMFATGLTAVFKELNVALSAQDQCSLQQFIYASGGLDAIRTEPDENRLLIAHYKA